MNTSSTKSCFFSPVNMGELDIIDYTIGFNPKDLSSHTTEQKMSSTVPWHNHALTVIETVGFMFGLFLVISGGPIVLGVGIVAFSLYHLIKDAIIHHSKPLAEEAKSHSA